MTTSAQHDWHEKEGVVYFSVTSDGTTGEQWIQRLEDNGFRVGDYAKQVLLHPNFNPTKNLASDVAILKGTLFEDNERCTEKIRAEAARRRLSAPQAELACLIREKFTDDDIDAMGLSYIVAMHEPISDAAGLPRLLNADRSHDGRWLYAHGDRPDRIRDRDFGFAFVVSKASSLCT
ncbi:MAG: hypothetical protein KBE09_04455 [Candidatus Pacebacteria bacterium]|nr:hypothetical protein [Candidatus Paceibacterota bacterium]